MTSPPARSSSKVRGIHRQSRVATAVALLVCVGALAAPALAAQVGAQRPNHKATVGPTRVFDRDYYRRPYPELIRARPAWLALVTVNEQEPNDGFMTAPLIALGDTVTGFIQTPGDVDYFAIDVPADTRLDLDIQAFTIGSDLDGRIDLYDTDGVTLLDFSDDVIGLDPRLVYEVLTAGRYYVRISDANGTGGGNHAYSVKLGIIVKGPGDPTTLWALGLGGPLGAAAGPEGDFYVVDNRGVRVLRVDGATGAPTQLASLVSTGTGPDFDVVRDLAVDAFGDVLAVGKRDLFQPVIWRIARDGTVSDFWVPTNLSSEYTSITVDPSGDVWAGDQAQGLKTMVRLSPFGDPLRQALEAIPIPDAMGDIYDMAMSPAGELHWSNSFGEIYKLNGTGAVELVVQTEPFIEGLAFDRDGYLYAANGGIGKVLLFDPAGTLVDDPFAGTNLAGPLNLVFGRGEDGTTTSRLFAVNFGVGLPPPFAGAMVEMNPAAIRAPGWPVADFLRVTATVPSAVYGVPYTGSLALSAGGAATWSIVEGALPFEVDLQPSTGAIVGLPQELGEVEVSFRAEAGGRVGFVRIRFRIDPLGVPADAVADVLLGGGTTLTAEEVSALDLIGNRNATLDIGDLRAHMRARGELTGPRVRTSEGAP